MYDSGLMDEQLNAFIEFLASRKGYAANTLAAYRNDLLQFLQFIAAERPHLTSWTRVDPLVLQAFLLQLKARAYSASSIARKIAALKSFYFFLFQEHALTTNPTLDLDAPPVPKQVPHVLTEEQVEALLSAAAGPTPKGYRDRAMLELLYAAGLRVSELVTLPLGAVDMDAGTLHVSGGRNARVLPLRERALTALREYLERGRRALKGLPEAGPLFVNSHGRQLTRQGVWLILKQYGDAARMDVDVTPYSLRHAFAAHHLARGERVQDLQRLLGHAHLSTTLAYSRPHESEPAEVA
jgi:integrase/recombinase XerD